MAKLIILRGNSGSGKTTVANRLRREMGYGTMVVPQDVIRREIIRAKDSETNPAIQLIHDTAVYGKQIGYDVIVEGILANKWYGTMLKELAAQFDAVYAYYYDISYEETVRRHKTKPNAADYGEKELREWWNDHDVLGWDGEVLFDESLSQDEIITRIISDVRM